MIHRESYQRSFSNLYSCSVAPLAPGSTVVYFIVSDGTSTPGEIVPENKSSTPFTFSSSYVVATSGIQLDSNEAQTYKNPHSKQRDLFSASDVKYSRLEFL